MQNRQISNLTEEQDQAIRKLCMEESLTFFQALKKKYPLLYF